MLKYFKLRKSLFSKSKRSISSPPRSIPHDRDIDEINPAQLDSVQELINDSITTMSDNLMAKFSSMFDQYHLGNIIFFVHLLCGAGAISHPY